MNANSSSSNHKEPNVECAYCQKAFYKVPSKIAKSKSGLFFCSREHQSIGFHKDSGIEVMPGPKPQEGNDRKRYTPKTSCKDCSLPRHNENLTDGRCFHCNRTFTQIQQWLNGDLAVTYSGVLKEPKDFVKSYLLLTKGDKCESCSFDKKKPNGDSIIQMNHIDGNYLNNKLDNLELLCPNCHAMTDTWGSKNTVTGRRKMAKILKEVVLETIGDHDGN